MGHIIPGSGIFGGSGCQCDSDFQMVISCAPTLHPKLRAQCSTLPGSRDPLSELPPSLKPVPPLPTDFWKNTFVFLFFSPLCLPAFKCLCHLQQTLLDHHPIMPYPSQLLLMILRHHHPGTTPMAFPFNALSPEGSSCVISCLRATARPGRDLLETHCHPGHLSEIPEMPTDREDQLRSCLEKL